MIAIGIFALLGLTVVTIWIWNDLIAPGTGNELRLALDQLEHQVELLEEEYYHEHPTLVR